MTHYDIASVIDRLHARTARGLADDEFTRAIYQDRTGLSLEQARGEIRRLRQAGLVERIGKRIVDGKWQNVYRLTNGKDNTE